MNISKCMANEKGFAFVLTLVMLAAMTAIGMAAMITMTTDIQIARNEFESKMAFYRAESGIEEAVGRLRLSSTNARYIGEKTTDANYRQTTWNNNNTLARDFGKDGSATRQSVDNLDYSVTIRYLAEGNPENLCDSNNASTGGLGKNSAAAGATYSEIPPATWTCPNSPAEIAMYGRDFNVPTNVTRIARGKMPIYKITSTGNYNNASVTNIAYFGATSLNTDTDYGINTNDCLNIAGGALNVGEVVQGDGCDCELAGPTGSCAGNKAADDDMNTYLGEELAEIIGYANESHRCENNPCNAGAGDDIPASGSIDTVVQDWGDAAGDTYSTMIYIDNDTGKEVSLTGNFSGRGILIVTGDLKLSGNLIYEGLVYVFGTLTISGGGSNLNVTGGIMANETVSVNGNVTVDYDQATLEDVARQNTSSAMVVWKRL